MLIKMLTVLTFLIICAWITYIDIRKQKIYNGAVAALLVPAIVSFFVFSEINPLSRVLGAISVSGMMLLISLIKPGSFGGGDVKLMVAVGLFLGLERALWAGILAVFVAGVWLLLSIVHKVVYKVYKIQPKTWLREKLPFGPALCMGAVLSLFLMSI